MIDAAFFPKKILIYLIVGMLNTLTILSTNGCSSEPKSIKIEERDGLLFLLGKDEIFTGKVVDTVSKKILEYEVVDGKKNGLFKISSTDGSVVMVGKIKDNVNEGQWCYYYPNGQIESVGNFANNLSEGKWTWYFESGKIREVGNFKAGKKDGNWTIYDEKGNIKRKLFFREDQIIFNQEFDKELFS